MWQCKHKKGFFKAEFANRRCKECFALHLEDRYVPEVKTGEKEEEFFGHGFSLKINIKE